MARTSTEEPVLSSVATIVAAWAAITSASLIWMPGIGGLRAVAVVLIVLAIGIAPERRRLRTLQTDRVLLTVVAIGLLAAYLFSMADLTRDEPAFAEGNDLRMLRLLAVFVAGRALFAVSRPRAAARWLGWMVAATILGVLAVLFAWAGINPATAMADAISEGRLRPILQAFKRIHDNANEDYGTAIMRHYEVRAMMVGAFLGLALLARGSRRSTLVLAVSAYVVAGTFAVVTFSRGNLLGAAVAGLPALVWFLRRVSMRWRVAAVAFLLVAAVGTLQIGVVGDGVSDGSSVSSEVRSDRLDQSLELLDDAVVLGVPLQLDDGTVVGSAHNIVLDLWLGGGAIAGIGGLVLLGLAVFLAAGTGLRALRAGSFDELAALTGLFGLFVMVIIRMLTGGGGLMDPTTWFGFGAALAIRAAAEQRTISRAPNTREPSTREPSTG